MEFLVVTRSFFGINWNCIVVYKCTRPCIRERHYLEEQTPPFPASTVISKSLCQCQSLARLIHPL